MKTVFVIIVWLFASIVIFVACAIIVKKFIILFLINQKNKKNKKKIKTQYEVRNKLSNQLYGFMSNFLKNINHLSIK